MKLPLLLFLLVSSCLHASAWQVQEQGQGYVLMVDGRPYMTIERNPDSQVVEMDGQRIVRTFDEGRLVSEDIVDASGLTTYSYEYAADGSLHRIIGSRDGQVIGTRQYHWSPLTGLAYYTDLGPDGLFLYSGDNLSMRLGDTVRVQDGQEAIMELRTGLSPGASADLERGEDGSATLREEVDGGVLTTIFDSSYRPVREEFADAEGAVLWTEVHEYDSTGALFLSRRDEGTRRTDSYYSIGMLTQQLIFEDGVVIERRSWPGDGTRIVIRYRNGGPYARIIYDDYSNVVLSLEML